MEFCALLKVGMPLVIAAVLVCLLAAGLTVGEED